MGVVGVFAGVAPKPIKSASAHTLTSRAGCARSAPSRNPALTPLPQLSYPSPAYLPSRGASGARLSRRLRRPPLALAAARPRAPPATQYESGPQPPPACARPRQPPKLPRMRPRSLYVASFTPEGPKPPSNPKCQLCAILRDPSLPPPFPRPGQPPPLSPTSRSRRASAGAFGAAHAAPAPPGALAPRHIRTLAPFFPPTT